MNRLAKSVIIGTFATAAFSAGYATAPHKPAPTPHDTQAKACWYELKPAGDSEQICGKVSLAPDNAYDFSVYTDAHLEEDQPGWNCKTMGNKICGPSTTTPKVSQSKPKRGARLAVKATTSTTQTIPQQLIDRIPDSDAELAFCEAINQPVGQCQLPEHEGMGEQ